LIDWKEVGVPNRDGTREGERELFNFRQVYNGFIESLAIVPTKNDAQIKQVSDLRKLLKERLTSIETEWERRKAP